MTKEERMKEIAKASPNFGKRVGYKMCVVDELHDMKELETQIQVGRMNDKGQQCLEDMIKLKVIKSVSTELLLKELKDRGKNENRKPNFLYLKHDMVDAIAYAIYYTANPKSEMCVPNCAYIQAEKMFEKWKEIKEND